MIELGGTKVRLMGVVNVTPDSFYDGGLHFSVDNAVRHGERLIAEGADILDIGGESSRPGAEAVPLAEEMKRVLPVVERLAIQVDVPISIDTYKEPVARSALDLGATIVNDISALRFDPNMARTIAKKGARVILMHMKGTPRDMQKNPTYEDAVAEIKDFLIERANFAISRGIPREAIMIDPGIGFGKMLEHNLEILANIRAFKECGFPVVIGTSRKSFIGKILGDIPPAERLYGSLGSAIYSAMNGADIIRVHDLRETKQALEIISAIEGQRTKERN